MVVVVLPNIGDQLDPCVTLFNTVIERSSGIRAIYDNELHIIGIGLRHRYLEVHHAILTFHDVLHGYLIIVDVARQIRYFFDDFVLEVDDNGNLKLGITPVI